MFRSILICLLALLACTKDPVVTLPDPPQKNQNENEDNN